MLSCVMSAFGKFAGVAAVAQDDHAVGAPLHLGEPVRDVQHRHARRLQAVDHVVEPFRLRLRQARRRLVHDEDADVRPERAGDLDELLLAGREGLDPRAGRGLRGRPTRASSFAARAAIAAGSSTRRPPAVVTSRPRNRLSATVRFSARFSSWWIRLTPARDRVARGRRSGPACRRAGPRRRRAGRRRRRSS